MSFPTISGPLHQRAGQTGSILGPKCQNQPETCGVSGFEDEIRWLAPAEQLIWALALEHHQVDGLNGRSVGLHNKLDLDPGLAKGSF